MNNDPNAPFQLLDPDEAVAIGCFLIALAALGNVFVPERPALPAPPQPVSRVAVCDVTVAQYGPGERWQPQPPQPTCIVTIRGELANHLLTSPMGKQ